MEQKITKPENIIPFRPCRLIDSNTMRNAMERNEIRHDILADIREQDLENRRMGLTDAERSQRDAGFPDPLGADWTAETVLRSATERSEFEATSERYPVPNMVQAISERWKRERIPLLKLLADTLAEARRIPVPNGGFRENPVS